ncbi:MAG: hydroxymethylglutaryl-CoA lyase [Alphaproteobacteria bacterium]|nr:hydroxymethylglutaryl-CoA lyase [Alphaproteobacteria bacterium]
MGERVYITEVGLRDGLQMLPQFVATADKLELCRALIATGVQSIEATSFVSPKAVPQMADAAELFAALPAAPEVTYSVLVPNEKGYERALAAGARDIALVLAATDTFNRKNINMSLEAATAVCETVIARGRGAGIRSRAYISAAFACPFEGATPMERVVALVGRMFDAGAEEVAIADTIGAGDPAHCQRLFRVLVSSWGAERLAAHFHDTRAMGLVLAWAALSEGVRRFDSVIGGLGGCPFAPGAAGNLATEDLVQMLEQSGFDTGIDVWGLRRTVRVAERILGQEIGGRVTKWLAAEERRRATAAA